MIFGAGATRAAIGNIKTKSRLPPLDRDFFSISSNISSQLTKNVINAVEDTFGDYSDAILESLETTTTYLYLKAIDSSPGSKIHQAFLDLMRLMNLTLAKTTNSIKAGPKSFLYRLLLNELNKVEKPEDLTVITFNYDLVLEKVLESIATHGKLNIFTFPGCYRLENIMGVTGISGEKSFLLNNRDHFGVPVLKLHGSLNWQSRHNSPTPNPQQLFQVNRRLYITNSPSLTDHLNWKTGKKTLFLKPIIVPPISGKRGLLHQSMPNIWQRAANALKVADRIIIIGYSCPSLDLESRILLSENLRLNNLKNIYVVDPVAETAARFSDICGVNHITTYRSVQDWLNDAPKYQ